MAKKNILIVEDEQVIRNLFRRVLDPMGYEVMAVGTVAEGLSQLESAPIDLLITDLRLTDGSGEDVAMAYSKRFPAQNILVVTGSITPGSLGPLESLPHCHFLYKPVEVNEFKAKVQQLLPL